MRTPVDFVDRSNAYSRGDLKVCKNHLRAKWGKRSDGSWFPKCAQGLKHNEECEELKEK